MKIIQAPDTAWSYKCTCSTCGAVLQVEKQDVKYEWHEDLREGYETWTAACPCCCYAIPIPVTGMSKAVQLEIRDKKMIGSINSLGEAFRNK